MSTASFCLSYTKNPMSMASVPDKLIGVSAGWRAVQVFVVSLVQTRPKRNDRQASHVSTPAEPTGLLNFPLCCALLLSLIRCWLLQDLPSSASLPLGRDSDLQARAESET
jgi:hypothetical protein